MFGIDSAQERFLRAFLRLGHLNEVERAAIGGLSIETREMSAASYLVREGDIPRRCLFLLNGFVYRQKLTFGGLRSIVGLCVPADFVDLQNLYLDISDHDVVALTNVVVVDIAIDQLRALAEKYPAINRALWTVSLVEASRYREGLLNIGRRDAHDRVAHLLCEISARLEAAGVARELTYELPMTQEQLGDTLGLTSVHINRVLKVLETEGLIRRRKREIVIADWEQLRRVADFNERYLHLKVGKAARAG